MKSSKLAKKSVAEPTITFTGYRRGRAGSGQDANRNRQCRGIPIDHPSRKIKRRGDDECLFLGTGKIGCNSSNPGQEAAGTH